MPATRRCRCSIPRKTTPGLRALEKAAVAAGGGVNHRSSLSEAVLVKDNHLAGITITEAVARARALWPGRVVQIECDTLDQVAEAAKAGADALLLDNMIPAPGGPCHRAGARQGSRADPDRGLGRGDARKHRRLRRRRTGPDFRGGADPFGPRARSGSRPHLAAIPAQNHHRAHTGEGD